MQNSDRRTAPRWPVAVTAKLGLNGIVYDTNILNVNLGGCFCEGYFPVREGELVTLTSIYNQMLNGIQASVCWIVEEPNLKGIGLRFHVTDEATKFAIMNWFNSLKKQ